MLHIFARCLLLALPAVAATAAEPPAALPPIHRRMLMQAALAAPAVVGQVQAHLIEFPGAIAAPPHQHPCPVVGVVLEGSIRFQVAGRPEQILRAGDTFLEPADTPIAHFDNPGPGRARFVAFYLAGADTGELTRLIR